jgi:hypothetical protein
VGAFAARRAAGLYGSCHCTAVLTGEASRQRVASFFRWVYSSIAILQTPGLDFSRVYGSQKVRWLLKGV